MTADTESTVAVKAFLSHDVISLSGAQGHVTNLFIRRFIEYLPFLDLHFTSSMPIFG